MRKVEDLTGQSFNGLTVLHYARSSPQGTYWRCRCDLCGAEKDIRADVLKSGKQKSCGCHRRERMRELGRSGVGPKHRWGGADDL